MIVHYFLLCMGGGGTFGAQIVPQKINKLYKMQDINKKEIMSELNKKS